MQWRNCFILIRLDKVTIVSCLQCPTNLNQSLSIIQSLHSLKPETPKSESLKSYRSEVASEILGKTIREAEQSPKLPAVVVSRLLHQKHQRVKQVHPFKQFLEVSASEVASGDVASENTKKSEADSSTPVSVQ